MGNLTLIDLNGHCYTLKNVLHVPTAKNQLLSLCQLIDSKLQFEFIDDTKNFVLKARNSLFQLHGFSRDNLLYIHEQSSQTQSYICTAVTRSEQKKARAREVYALTPSRKKRRTIQAEVDQLHLHDDEFNHTLPNSESSSSSIMSLSLSPSPQLHCSGLIESPIQLHPDDKLSY